MAGVPRATRKGTHMTQVNPPLHEGDFDPRTGGPHVLTPEERAAQEAEADRQRDEIIRNLKPGDTDPRTGGPYEPTPEERAAQEAEADRQRDEIIRNLKPGDT